MRQSPFCVEGVVKLRVGEKYGSGLKLTEGVGVCIMRIAKKS